MKCPKCNIELYNNCCMKCGYMPNGNSVIDNQENIEGIGKISNLDNIEKEQQLAYNDYIKANNDYKKHRNKKWLIIVSIVVLVVAIIKIFFGTIEIGNPFYYPDDKVLLLYDVKINDMSISTDNTTIHKLPIIPFLVTFNSVSLYQTDIKEGLKQEYYVDKSEKTMLSIQAYSCYSELVKGQVKCDSLDYNRILKEQNNVKYTNLYIQKNNKPQKVIYNGKFINDITEYVSVKGRYSVKITAKYGFVEVYIYFDIINK